MVSSPSLSSTKLSSKKVFVIVVHIWWPGEERRFMQAAVTEREAAEARRAGVVGVRVPRVGSKSHT